MFAGEVIVLVAAIVACVAALVGAGAAVALSGQVRRLEKAVELLREESVPLVVEARQAAQHAVSEMERVEAVLEDTGAVTATVESASRLARKTFASPIVKVLAFRAGAAGGLRRLREGEKGTPQNERSRGSS
ncbi:MAG: hypothetical protein M0Z95_25205 [Actinomycetota bacterium]|jgi:hypothetical protein|nr:hypothetical protein [Actinomycetota bacterium]